MADHLAARNRCAEFLKEHTEHVFQEGLPSLEECPICLDTYQKEQAVRIKLNGCNHIFGRNCLKVILTTNPRMEKNCPLCRTKWMDAPAEPDLPTSVRRQRQHPRATLLSTTLPSTTLPSATLPPGQATAPSRPGFVDLIRGDSDEDPVNTFNSFRRDINDIRERARNTRANRKKRQEEKKPDAPPSLFPRPSLTKKEDTSNSQQGQRGRKEPLASFPIVSSQAPSHPPLFASGLFAGAPDWFMPSITHDAGTTPPTALPALKPSAGQSSGGAQNNNEPSGPWSFGQQPSQSSGGAQNNTEHSSQCSFAQPPAHPGSLHFLRPGGRPIPFVLSPSPDSDADAVRKEHLELARREKDLAERDNFVKERERYLENREKMLDERDRSLFRREQRVAQRESADTRLADMRANQLNELEAMIARHRRESGV